MNDADRNDFDKSLDMLARILRLTPLDSEQKFGYFKALRRQSMTAFVESMTTVSQTYKPRRKDDFPVPAIIIEAITGVVEASKSGAPERSRSYDQVKSEYRARGILIGAEAVAAMERQRDEAFRQLEAENSQGNLEPDWIEGDV